MKIYNLNYNSSNTDLKKQMFLSTILDTNNKYKNINLSESLKIFEGLFINILLKSMKNSFLKNKDWITSNQESLFQDIYDQYLTQIISKKGLGLSILIHNQIKKTEKIPEEILKINELKNNLKINNKTYNGNNNANLIKFINVSQSLLLK